MVVGVREGGSGWNLDFITHWSHITYPYLLELSLAYTLDGATRRSADFEGSSNWNSDTSICRSYVLAVNVGGINGSSLLRRLLTCDNVLQHVTPSKI